MFQFIPAGIIEIYLTTRSEMTVLNYLIKISRYGGRRKTDCLFMNEFLTATHNMCFCFFVFVFFSMGNNPILYHNSSRYKTTHPWPGGEGVTYSFFLFFLFFYPGFFSFFFFHKASKMQNFLKSNFSNGMSQHSRKSYPFVYVNKYNFLLRVLFNRSSSANNEKQPREK